MTTKAEAEAAETTNINRTTNRDKHAGQETPPVPEPKAEGQDDVEVHEQHVEIVMIRNVLDPHHPIGNAEATGKSACHFVVPSVVVHHPKTTSFVEIVYNAATSITTLE